MGAQVVKLEPIIDDSYLWLPPGQPITAELGRQVRELALLSGRIWKNPKIGISFVVQRREMDAVGCGTAMVFAMVPNSTQMILLSMCVCVCCMCGACVRAHAGVHVHVCARSRAPQNLVLHLCKQGIATSSRLQCGGGEGA